MGKRFKILAFIIGILVTVSVLLYFYRVEEDKKIMNRQEKYSDEKELADKKDKEIREKIELNERKIKEKRKKMELYIQDSPLSERKMTMVMREMDTGIKTVKIQEDFVSIKYEVDWEQWDETSLFHNAADKSAWIFNMFLKRSDVNKVTVAFPITFMDQNRKVSVSDAISITLTKETSENIDYKRAMELVKTNPSAMYDAANAYNIHPEVYENINKEFLDGLKAGMRKSQ